MQKEIWFARMVKSLLSNALNVLREISTEEQKNYTNAKAVKDVLAKQNAVSRLKETVQHD